MDVWSNVPKDIVLFIFSLCERNDIAALCSTSKRFNGLIQKNLGRVFNMGTGKYVPFPEQIKLYFDIRKSIEPLLAIESPMSSGKTALMLMLAHDSEHKTLICINTRVFTSWIKELKQMGFRISTNPDKSDVLIVHTKYQKHRILALTGMHTSKHKIVITTAYYVNHTRYGIGIWVLNNRANIFVDEAHIGANHPRNIGDYFRNAYQRKAEPKYLMFSASPINVPNVKKLVWNYSEKSQAELPRLNVKHVEKISLQAYLKNTKKKHIVVFTFMKGTDRTKLCRSLKDINGFKIFKFINTTTSTLDRFFDSEKGVIVCSYGTGAEGINLTVCDCVILKQFHNVGVEKSRQVLGRVRRRNSKHKIIKCILETTNDDIHHILSRTSLIYALRMELPLFCRKERLQIRLILDKMKENGVDHKKLTDYELLCIFTMREYIPMFGELSMNAEDILTYTRM